MIGTLKNFFHIGTFFWGLHLLLLSLLLLLRKYLLEFQKRDSLQNTYCMHMHSIRIMHAQEMEDDDEMYSHV